MKKILLCILLTSFSLAGFAQMNFEKGYFISEANQKTECLIKNLDWKNSPTTFEYKFSETDAPIVATIQNVKEFGVGNLAKFIKFTVDIDKSSVNTSDLSREKNPIYSRETQFLRLLVQGEYSLYEFSEGNSKKYFYQKNDDELKPLVYKKYLGGLYYTEALVNNTYKQQLFNDLKCPTTTMKDIERLDYYKTELQRFFIKYNECQNVAPTYVQEKPDRNIFDLSIRPRINSSSLKFHDQNSVHYDNKFKSQFDFGIGVEFELFLPYNKNTWSIFLEPVYHSYSATGRTGRLMNYTANVNYNSIELPVGLRHYIYLNNTSKLFVNAAYVFSYDNDATYELVRDDLRDIKTLEITPSSNLALGAGYKYNDKFSAEIRFQTRALLNQYYIYDTTFTQFSFILGYTIF